jgi:hypothetical protein
VGVGGEAGAGAGAGEAGEGAGDGDGVGAGGLGAGDAGWDAGACEGCARSPAGVSHKRNVDVRATKRSERIRRTFYHRIEREEPAPSGFDGLERFWLTPVGLSDSSARAERTVARFRLRFLLQEIDLGPGITVIGRSATCQITIDDPLVSREHARIRVEGSRITLEDLQSRNGVQVGGKPLRGVVELKDGERIRIGSQELVLCVIGSTAAQQAQRRTTGFMCHCADCGIPYAAESLACPACGSTLREQEDTLSGAKSERDWSLELAAEAVTRALEKQSWEDVERLLMRARLHLEQRLAEGGSVDRRPLQGVGDAAVALALTTGDLAWVRWALSLYATLGQLPTLKLARSLARFPAASRESLSPALRRVIETVTAQGGPTPEDRECFDALVKLAPES